MMTEAPAAAEIASPTDIVPEETANSSMTKNALASNPDIVPVPTIAQAPTIAIRVPFPVMTSAIIPVTVIITGEIYTTVCPTIPRCPRCVLTAVRCHHPLSGHITVCPCSAPFWASRSAQPWISP